MVFGIIILILGLILLLAGGHLTVNGASSLAKSFGISQLVIGLTIVAFGTSAPELAVNLIAAIQGNPQISFGNIIGSNIANIGLIAGITAFMKPIKIESKLISRETPFMVLASIFVIILASDQLFRGIPNYFDRSDGIVLLLLFGIFLYFTVFDLLNRRTKDAFVEQVDEFTEKSIKKTIFSFWIFLLGLILLVVGAKLTIDSAVTIAERLEVPNVIIGLTVIAIGTSLPELVTSAVAAWKGQTDLAIGNLIGSNIFNILLILGLCSVISPIPVPVAGGIIDIYSMLIISAVLLPLSLTNNRTLIKWEGFLLVFLYFLYLSLRFYI